MQYIWSQEEMDANRQMLADVRRLPSPKKLQEFCSMVADTMVLTEGWRAGHVWGCILTTKREWYCDQCPAKDVCPNLGKQWSK